MSLLFQGTLCYSHCYYVHFISIDVSSLRLTAFLHAHVSFILFRQYNYEKASYAFTLYQINDISVTYYNTHIITFVSL